MPCPGGSGQGSALAVLQSDQQLVGEFEDGVSSGPGVSNGEQLLTHIISHDVK